MGVRAAGEGGAPVLSQVTAQFTINDGIAPFYDFDLHFEARAAPCLRLISYQDDPM